ncbi:MAG: polysaccharide deacetylase family protein [Bacteroidales bacterium]|nr:polysaccharide deacetylase family protein [Bacteroidales bacterium]
MDSFQRTIRSFIKSYSDYIRYKLLRDYWQYRSRNSRLHGDVLMFHSVDDSQLGDKPYCCPINKFISIIDEYIRNSYSFVSIDEMLEIMKCHSNRKFAVITFDDIPDNVYKNAYLILKSKGIPFTIFITTNFIGKNGYISETELLEMSKDPLCCVGAHTMTHPMLRKVSNSVQEMTESKQILEELIGKEVKYMAYPYGRRTSVSVKIEKEAETIGYTAAFGTIGVPISDYTARHLFYLPRIVGERITM